MSKEEEDDSAAGRANEGLAAAETIVDIEFANDAIVDIGSAADEVGCFALPASEDDCEAFGECLLAIVLYVLVNLALFAVEMWMMRRGNVNVLVFIWVMFAHSLIILLFGIYPALD